MRAWWSMLLVPNMETNLRSICDCSLLCLEEPTQKTASGPLSLRIEESLSLISLNAWSQLMRWYLPSTSFFGVLRRCECSVMPCSRIDAPLAQCAPMLRGESNTGSWRTQTPSTTTASMAHPTEQCVQTVRLVTDLPVFASAFASPTKLSGSCEANAVAPAVSPAPFRNERRSTVRMPSADAARESGLSAWTSPSDLRVSNMIGSSDLRGLVVLADVLGLPVLGFLRGRDGLHLRLARGLAARGDGCGDPGASQAGSEQEVAAIGRFGRF